MRANARRFGRGRPHSRSRALLSKACTLALIMLCLLLTLGAGDNAARFQSLGHRMMCTCGCNQILLECNHVGCTVSETMRGELTAALSRGDNDDLILQGFVQKYGATVLAAPTSTGFNRVAWIMPFVVLAAGTWLAVLFVRRWQSAQSPAPASQGAIASPEVEAALRRRARQETDV